MANLNNSYPLGKKEGFVTRLIKFFDYHTKDLFYKLLKLRMGQSFYVLLLFNIVFIFVAVNQRIDIQTLLFIYWCQTVIIGIFTFITILQSRNLSTENFKTKQIPSDSPERTSISTGIFFFLHYEFFHLLYLLFIIGRFNFIPGFLFATIFGISLFFVVHLFSYIINHKSDNDRVQNVGKAMFFPYLRILPMQAIIVLGFFILKTDKIILFLILKTIADCVMHYLEHKGNNSENLIKLWPVIDWVKFKIQTIKSRKNSRDPLIKGGTKVNPRSQTFDPNIEYNVKGV